MTRGEWLVIALMVVGVLLVAVPVLGGAAGLW